MNTLSPLTPPVGVDGSRTAPAVVRPALLDGVRSAEGSEQPRSASAPSFKDVLSRALAAVDASQKEADLMGVRLAAGENVELHHVTMAQERAMLHLELTLAVQRKVVEAYQEISRMQV